MIKRFHEYNLDNELDFLFNGTNESLIDFKKRLISIIDKLKNKLDLNKLIEKLFIYLKQKTLPFKKMAINTLFIGLGVSSIYNVDDVIKNNQEVNQIVMSDSEIRQAIEEAKLNKLFDDYEKRVAAYLSRPNYKNSPLTAEMFSNGARKAYEKHGILIPAELALAQAQFESHFGTTGRSPVNNPFNVGEYDDRTAMTFDSPQEGIDAYFDLMVTDYLSDKTVEELLNNFVNKDGKRYASNRKYESDIKNQYEYNKKWIDKNLGIENQSTQWNLLADKD